MGIRLRFSHKNKMEKEGDYTHKPHCLILPFPRQGHINPMLQFSKRLAHKGISITLAVTKHLFKTTKQFPNSISVETISDGYDDGKDNTTLDVYLSRFQKVGTETLAQLLDKLNNSGRTIDCVIYDPFLPWGLTVAKKFGLIVAAFFTQSCAVNNIYYLVYKGQLQVPLLDKEYSIPGLPILEPSDLPSFVYDPKRHPWCLELLRDQFQNIEDADYVFVNSIYQLEKEATDWMAKFVQVKPIGPTIPSMYLDKRLLEDKDYGLSIFSPVHDCMNWLDEKPSRSVVYVSFGSMAQLKEAEMMELALGLKLTNNYFLWVVRSSEKSKLPRNFEQETSEKGLIVSWCPQLEVLTHESISCFVTHCGWNSTLEALSLGVPMVAVPWWSDQSTNAKLVMSGWKMGVRARPNIDNIVRREEIASCVKCVIDGDQGGEEIRKNARKWKELAIDAINVGGTSDRNIEEFVYALGVRASK